jgi:ABC-type spermidine/putrescine transport system permease subunit II
VTSYQPVPTQYGQAPQQRFNTLSIVAFVLAFVVSLGAVICGHIALSQIKRTGERGRGLAIAALVLGYLGILLGIVYAVAIIGLLAGGVVTTGSAGV